MLVSAERGLSMAKRARGDGGLIKRAGSRFWWAQYYRNGRQIRVSTKTAVKEEAKAVLRRLMGDNERGLVPASDMKKVRYGDLRELLLDSYRTKGNKSLQVTADGDETIWGLKALDDFFQWSDKNPGPPVTAITSDAARQFARERRGVTGSTVNLSLALLRRMLRLAHDTGKIHAVPKIWFLKENPPRKGIVAPDKFDVLVAALPLHLRPLITFLFWTGVRIGEAMQIDWIQVELDAALITLEDKQTKSGDPRIIPLPDTLVEMLRAQEPKTGKVFDDTNIRDGWQRACVAAGLGTLTKVTGKPYDPVYSGLRIHDLRRTALTYLRKSGVDESVVMKISGHKTRDVFERYNIVDAADVTDAMRARQQFGARSMQALPPAKAKRRG